MTPQPALVLIIVGFAIVVLAIVLRLLRLLTCV